MGSTHGGRLGLVMLLCLVFIPQCYPIRGNSALRKKIYSLVNVRHSFMDLFIKRLKRGDVNGDKDNSGSGSGNSGSGGGSGVQPMQRSIISRLSRGSHDLRTPKSIVTCRGKKERIKCPRKHTIKLRSAFWGRDDGTTCGKNPANSVLSIPNMCLRDNGNTIARLEGKCNDKNACQVAASRAFLSHLQCQDKYKYLRVTYSCLPSNVQSFGQP